MLQIGDYNKKGYDRTCWYAFADDDVRKQAQSSKPVYFQVEYAVKYGIVAAVLLGNLEYWVRENRKKDVSYTWQPVSLGELARHLPFSKATMHRAFKTLVDRKALKSRLTKSKRGVVEYSLVDETRLKDAKLGGSKSDMGVAGSGSKSDMATVSNPDMTVSNSDMTVSFSDNNTILIETHLKEPCLKEPSYVDAGLPTTVSNTTKADKLKQVKGVNPFLAPVFKSGKGTASDKSQQSKLSDRSSGSSKDQLLTLSGTGQLQDSGKSANQQKSSTAKESPELSSLSSSSSSIPTSPATPPTSESDRYESGPMSETRVKLSVSLEHNFFTYSKMVSEAGEGGVCAAKLALQWISLFLQQAKPEELIEVLKITDQKALYDKLADLFTPHLAKYLEPFLENQKELDKVQVISKLVMQFLTQGLCRFDDDLYYALGTPYPHRVALMLYEKLQPYFDAREEEQRKKLKDRQTQILKDRSQQYKSPDKLKETRAEISAAEKVQVLRNALIAINNIGAFNDKNQLKHQVVEYNNRTFDAALVFFQANPDFTVAHLLKVLEKCLELPQERDYREEGNDPLWHARKGRDISFLLQHLDIVVGSLGCVDEIAHFQPLPPGTLSKKPSQSSKATEPDDG